MKKGKMFYIILTIFALSAIVNASTINVDCAYDYDISGTVKNAQTLALVDNALVQMWIYDFELGDFVFIRSTYTDNGQFTIGYNADEVSGLVWLPIVCVQDSNWDWEWQEVESDIFMQKYALLHHDILVYSDDGPETFYGYVKNSVTHAAIANAKVEVYKTYTFGTPSIKLTTVYTNSLGKYTFQFEHGQTWWLDDFTIVVTKTGYITPKTFTDMCSHNLLHIGGTLSVAYIRAYE